MKVRTMLLIPAIALICLGFIWNARRDIPDQSPLVAVPFVGRQAVTPAPTPFPFQELTIPYLRNRSYGSSLGERAKVSEYAAYTSYTTFYVSDGLKINGLLTIPKTEKPAGGFPAIVFVHGYIPPTQYRTTVNYASYVDVFARNGFVVFKIDLRGHDRSEGEPGGAYYSSDYVVDTLNARAALAAGDIVNPKRIGLWGHSMAGNVVARSLAAKPDIPAVVIWAGAGYTYADLTTYRISDTSYRPPPNNTERQRKRQLLRDTYGDFDAVSPFWRQVAVTEYLPEFRGTVQLHHAADDQVVSIEYSRNLTNLLKSAGVAHEFYEYPNGGHNLTGSVFTEAMQRSVEFFKTGL